MRCQLEGLLHSHMEHRIHVMCLYGTKYMLLIRNNGMYSDQGNTSKLLRS